MRHGFSPWVKKLPWRRAWQPNPMDRGGWRAIVHKVTKSWTQLGTQHAERTERKKGPEKIYEEIIVENVPEWERKSQPRPGSAEKRPRINPRSNISRHIVIKLTKIKNKDKILKATREK